MGHRTLVALAAGSAVYAARHFAIKTDVNDLFPADLPWTRRALEFMRTFPQPDILVIVDAPTPEFVEEASNKLAQALATRRDLLRGIHQLDSGPFFEQNGLLFPAKPLIQTLSTDPSLRGSLNALSFGLMGVAGGMLKLDDLAWPMTRAARGDHGHGFGSLWLSNDPGTFSMGRLMALALICTMAAAVFFQPALMGPLRARPSRSEPAFEPLQEPVPSRRPEAEMVER